MQFNWKIYSVNSPLSRWRRSKNPKNLADHQCQNWTGLLQGYPVKVQDNCNYSGWWSRLVLLPWMKSSMNCKLYIIVFFYFLFSLNSWRWFFSCFSGFQNRSWMSPSYSLLWTIVLVVVLFFLKTTGPEVRYFELVVEDSSANVVIKIRNVSPFCLVYLMLCHIFILWSLYSEVIKLV